MNVQSLRHGATMNRTGRVGICLSLILISACSDQPLVERTFAYVSDFDPWTARSGQSRRISTYSVDPATGAWRGTGSVSESPGAVVLDPQGRFLFVGRWGVRKSWPDGYLRRAELATYRVDSSAGTLSVSGLTDLGDVDATVAVADPTGRFLYVADQSFPGSRTYSTNAVAARLTLLSVNDTVAPQSVAIDPLGRFLYLVDWSQRIIGYAIEGGGGLRRIGEIAGGERVVVDPSGRCLYTSRRSTCELVAFAIDGATGGLSTIAAVPTGPAPGPLVVDRSGRFLYVVSDNDIAGFRLDPSTGVPVSIGIVAVGVRGELAVHPTLGFLYVARMAESHVVGYTIDDWTGGLAPIGVVSEEGGGWVGLVTAPNTLRTR